MMGLGTLSADELREYVFERDGHSCRRCRGDVCLDVHHRNGDAADNRDENLETVCGVCHLNAHRTLRAVRAYRERIDREGVAS